jgi:hypothetical protein
MSGYHPDWIGALTAGVGIGSHFLLAREFGLNKIVVRRSSSLR